MANNTVTGPKGFLVAGLSCGIKRSGKPDLALIVCPGKATAAAVFTTNKIVSAAVTVCKSHLNSRSVSAVIVNSGNANACTGRRGIASAKRMCSETARRINAKPESVLVASTGIIGVQMPIEKVAAGIDRAVKRLSDSAKAGEDFAEAIMTTDTRCKQSFCRLKISGTGVMIAATVKGAGMIGPNMATMLCFITTDAAISRALLGKALKDAVGSSLNKLTVDGHQSTNDTAIILASAAAGNRPVAKTGSNYKKFARALKNLCDDLTKQMALDAEGATRMFKVVVKGAANKLDAATAARAIANYPLVKCAVHGGDPNWGRIICAAGSCGVRLNEKKLSCSLDDIAVFKNGSPQKFDPAKASKVVSQKEHTITVNLGAGKSEDFCYGCDLSREYVAVNADYHT